MDSSPVLFAWFQHPLSVSNATFQCLFRLTHDACPLRRGRDDSRFQLKAGISPSLPLRSRFRRFSLFLLPSLSERITNHQSHARGSNHAIVFTRLLSLYGGLAPRFQFLQNPGIISHPPLLDHPPPFPRQVVFDTPAASSSCARLSMCPVTKCPK